MTLIPAMFGNPYMSHPGEKVAERLWKEGSFVNWPALCVPPKKLLKLEMLGVESRIFFKSKDFPPGNTHIVRVPS